MSELLNLAQRERAHRLQREREQTDRTLRAIRYLNGPTVQELADHLHPHVRFVLDPVRSATRELRVTNRAWCDGAGRWWVGTRPLFLVPLSFFRSLQEIYMGRLPAVTKDAVLAVFQEDPHRDLKLSFVIDRLEAKGFATDYDVVRQILYDLREGGKLVRRGDGAGTRYVLPPAQRPVLPKPEPAAPPPTPTPGPVRAPPPTTPTAAAPAAEVVAPASADPDPLVRLLEDEPSPAAETVGPSAPGETPADNTPANHAEPSRAELLVFAMRASIRATKGPMKPLVEAFAALATFEELRPLLERKTTGRLLLFLALEE